MLAAVPAEASPKAAERLPLADLSRLLLLTNGITGRGGRLRAAPSAGALYAGEVYLLAERVAGLEPGVYYYGVRGHALVPVSDARLTDLAAALETPGEAAGVAAAVLLTNVFARYRVRYAHRGYRYALIDSGHIGENLSLAAGELGLPARAARRFEDDRLNALLAIDGRQEAVCAVHLVGGEGGRAGPSARTLAECGTVDPEAIPAGLSEPERYHEATKLMEVASAARPREVSSSAPLAAAPAAAGPPPAMAVHAAIRTRRSARRFEPRPVDPADLRRVLAFAAGVAAGEPVALHVVAHRVTDLDPGVYAYDAASGSLARRRAEPLVDDLVRACLGQEKSGQAAAAVIAVADLATAAARGGARSYRDVLLTAGSAAQRVYLAAEAHGLTARNLAAYYDDELDALLGLDGVRTVAVHLTALGPGD